MKTIRIQRIDDQVPPPSGNPFSVCSRIMFILTRGHTTVLPTGLKIDIPDETRLVVDRNLKDGIVITGCCKLEGDELGLSICSPYDTDMIVIRPYDKLASMSVVGTNLENIRFVEYSAEGKRQAVFGDAAATVSSSKAE